MTIEERLENLITEVRQIMISSRNDPIRIHKNPKQLLSLLKRKNESYP